MKELNEAREEIRECNGETAAVFFAGKWCYKAEQEAIDRILNLKGDGWKIAIISTSAGVSRGYDDKKWKQVIWEGEK